MTDIPALDAEIVKAATDVVDKWRSVGILTSPDGWPECRALEAAVAARAAADRPKPLSAIEAARLLIEADPVVIGEAIIKHKSMQAVLTACRERDLKVLEAALRPLIAAPAPPGGGAMTVEWDKVHEVIRSALLPPNPLTGG